MFFLFKISRIFFKSLKVLLGKCYLCRIIKKGRKCIRWSCSSIVLIAVRRLLKSMMRNQSVVPIVALSIMSAGLIQKAVALPLLVTLLISVVVGVLCGMVNGFLIAFLRIPSIIVTLGTMNAFRGLTFLISEGKQITSSELPDKIDNIIRTGINLGSFQLPWIVVITFVLVVFFYFFLTQTHTGREVYAVGSNWTAAYLRGIKCKRIQFLVFAITGALCGAAGYMYAARYGYINPSNTGNGIEFVVISATIIGGVGVNGGSGNVFGVYLGCILLASLNTLISVTGIPGTVQKFCYGLIILIALLVDLAVKVMQDKRRLKELIEKERIKV